ncbi:hypothetical protein BLOT_014168 [Blomia tropicalis]|nr:hypothetical protein BLOT_014168 [Blomia tropicalis]
MYRTISSSQNKFDIIVAYNWQHAWYGMHAVQCILGGNSRPHYFDYFKSNQLDDQFNMTQESSLKKMFILSASPDLLNSKRYQTQL